MTALVMLEGEIPRTPPILLHFVVNVLFTPQPGRVQPVVTGIIINNGCQLSNL